MMCVLRLTTVIWEELDLFTLLKLHQNFGGQTLFLKSNMIQLVQIVLVTVFLA